MVDGVHTVAVHSRAKISQRLTGLRLMQHVGWQSHWCMLDCVDVSLSRLVFCCCFFAPAVVHLFVIHVVSVITEVLTYTLGCSCGASNISFI